jgi:hypothetical protein
MRPSTRLKVALRAALRRRYGYAALRLLRVALRKALADHQRRQLGDRPYAAGPELEAVHTRYRQAVRRLRKRWPALDYGDSRAGVDAVQK